MAYTVYGLRCPIEDTIMYVGETNNFPRRMCEHLSLRGHNLGLNAWIATLAVKGYVPIPVVFDIVETPKDAHTRESYFIGFHSQEGHTLYNL